MTTSDINRRNRRLARAASAAGGYHALAARLAQKENEAMEMWDGSFDVPGDVPARMPTTTHDSSRSTGSSIVHKGRVVDLSAPGPANRYMRVSIDPNGAGLGSPEDAMRWAAARIGRDAYEVLGDRAMGEVDVRAVWVSPTDWATEAIVVASHDARTRWKASGSEISASLRDLAGDPIVPHDAHVWHDAKASRHYRSAVSLMRSEEQRKATASPAFLTYALPSLIMGVAGLLAFPLLGTWNAASILTGAAAMLGIALVTPGPSGSSTIKGIVAANHGRLALLLLAATAAGQIYGDRSVFLFQAFLALLVLIRWMYHGDENAPADRRLSDEPHRPDARGPEKAIDTLLSVCSALPQHRQEDARTAAERCRMVLGFDAEDPVVADARRSVHALQEVLDAHRKASRYASADDAAPLALKVLDAMTSAGEDAERARVHLLSSATDALDTQTRYLASRAPVRSSLDSIR